MGFLWRWVDGMGVGPVFPVEMKNEAGLLETECSAQPLQTSGNSCFYCPRSRPRHGVQGAFSWFPLHQDLVFDLGDPVRWEYMLLGTDKPHLSLTEEDDEGLDDDDDVDDLVSLVA